MGHKATVKSVGGSC